MRAYRIRGWEKHFENSETRKLKRLTWIPVPNKHDGAGYRALWGNLPASPEVPGGFRGAPEVFAGFILLLELASKCPERGLLVKDGRPLTTREMALKTGAPEQLFAESIQALTSPEVGWIEEVEMEIPGNLPASPETSGRNGREGNRLEGKGREGKETATATAGTEKRPGAVASHLPPKSPNNAKPAFTDPMDVVRKILPAALVRGASMARVSVYTLAKIAAVAGYSPVNLLAWCYVASRDVRAGDAGKREKIESPDAWYTALATGPTSPPDADYDEAKKTLRVERDSAEIPERERKLLADIVAKMGAGHG